VSQATRKIGVVVLLLLCLGVPAAEATGYWDTAIQDTSDELSVVAVALCVGVAVSAAGTVVARVARALQSTSVSHSSKTPLLTRDAVPLLPSIHLAALPSPLLRI
jgi:hypothetical protein